MAKQQKKTEEDNQTLAIGKQKVSVTHLNKLYWPDEKISKGDLIRYYNAVAPYILPYLKNRPLSLKRNPNGILDKGFFHKDAGDAAPSWVKTESIYADSADKDINYIVCNDAASLIYVANMGCIEINPWNSTIKKQDHPSYLIIDIDPSDHNSFEQVIETAQVVKQILDKGKASSYCKTSGATGLHVYVPLGAKYEFELAKEFAHVVAEMVVEQLPGFTTLERSLSKRGKRIYVDYLQNRRGQTLCCAFSARPKAGAPVSTPLDWKEVKKGLHPAQFTIRNIIKRTEKNGNPFLAVLGKGIDLKSCLREIS